VEVPDAQPNNIAYGENCRDYVKRNPTTKTLQGVQVRRAKLAAILEHERWDTDSAAFDRPPPPPPDPTADPHGAQLHSLIMQLGGSAMLDDGEEECGETADDTASAYPGRFSALFASSEPPANSLATASLCMLSAVDYASHTAILSQGVAGASRGVDGASTASALILGPQATDAAHGMPDAPHLNTLASPAVPLDTQSSLFGSDAAWNLVEASWLQGAPAISTAHTTRHTEVAPSA
jgi:hypothetical protein